jgi:hypothetical protein
MIDDEEKKFVISAIESGFVNSSRIVGVAYALDKFNKMEPEATFLPDLEEKFKLVVRDSGLSDILEDQIDYYLSLVNYDGELTWEETEKIDELEVGISKLLELGIPCDEKFSVIFEETKDIRCK